ncbi:MAG: T9SS type A sorting domain-containing protein [Rhodothermales bacterium]
MITNRYAFLSFSKLSGSSITGLSMALFVLLSFSNNAFAQRTVEVAQGFDTLNMAINSDTTSTGARVDSNTVYVLERDGIYLLNGSIENRFPLAIVAADGEGARPVLRPGNADGGASSRPFRPRADLTLRGLYVTNEDELGGRNTRILRLSADNIRISIEDCHLDKDAQSAFRFDNDGISVFIKNSIISNIGRSASMNNGRGFDTRGNQIDSLVIENSTFYNLTSRIVRSDVGGLINYHRFDHNTVVNTGQFVSSPQEVLEMVWTNNNVINGGYLGQTDSSNADRQMLQVDSLSVEGDQTIRISNNNFYTDPSLLAASGDSVRTLPLFSPTAQAYLDERGFGDTITEEAIMFANGPVTPLDVYTARWTVGNENAEDDSIPDMSDDGAPFDFSYADTFTAFMGSRAGQPLGDLTWFEQEITPVAIDAFSDERPDSFELRGNYPNPFNPSTIIQFDLPQAADVNIVVFDLLGREAMRLSAGALTAGTSHAVLLDASALSSGVYLYQVRAETASQVLVETGRMILMK